MIKITKEPLSLSAIYQAVEDNSAGGAALFVGRVRDMADGRQVKRMTYEAFESMALQEMKKLAEAAEKKWPIKKMALVHRIGMLELGEPSVIVAVACEHRKEAFEACRFLIDALKKTVPIWKKEFGPDGSVWVEGVVPQSVELSLIHI